MSLINAPLRNNAFAVIYVITILSSSLLALVGSTPAGKSVKGSPPTVDKDAEKFFRVVNGARSFKLACPVNVNDDEELLIEWRKDDKEIRDDFEDRYKLAKGNRELKIKSTIKDSDAGLYSCRAANGFGHVEWTFEVEIVDSKEPKLPREESIILSGSKNAAPKWYNLTTMREDARAPIRLKQGESLKLHCAAEGNPLPMIKWYKDGLELYLQNKEVDRSRSAELLLKKVTSSDSGEYVCQVYNKYGLLNATFQICVSGYGVSTKCKADSPTIDRPHSAVTLGRTAQFQCTYKRFVGDKVEPAIKWLKLVTDEAEIRRAQPPSYFNYSGSTFFILEQKPNEQIHSGDVYVNRLVIPNTRYEHAGTYVCAVQTNGPFEHTTADLEVLPGADQDSSFSSLYFYLGIPVMIIILIFVAYAVHFLHRNRQTDKNGGSSRFASDSMKPIVNSKYSLPPPPLMPPPQAPVAGYMTQQHTLSRAHPTPQYLTQEMIYNQPMQQKCYPYIPSLNRSKRLPYQPCLTPASIPYTSDTASNLYEASPTHFHSSQTLPASGQSNLVNFDIEYPRGRRQPCPTEVDDYSEQRQPFISGNVF